MDWVTFYMNVASKPVNNIAFQKLIVMFRLIISVVLTIRGDSLLLSDICYQVAIYFLDDSVCIRKASCQRLTICVVKEGLFIYNCFKILVAILFQKKNSIIVPVQKLSCRVSPTTLYPTLAQHVYR